MSLKLFYCCLDFSVVSVWTQQEFGDNLFVLSVSVCPYLYMWRAGGQRRRGRGFGLTAKTTKPSWNHLSAKTPVTTCCAFIKLQLRQLDPVSSHNKPWCCTQTLSKQWIRNILHLNITIILTVCNIWCQYYLFIMKWNGLCFYIIWIKVLVHLPWCTYNHDSLV